MPFVVGLDVRMTSFFYPVVQKTTSIPPATSRHGTITAPSEEIHGSDGNYVIRGIADEDHKHPVLRRPASRKFHGMQRVLLWQLMSMTPLPQGSVTINLHTGRRCKIETQQAHGLRIAPRLDTCWEGGWALHSNQARRSISRKKPPHRCGAKAL